MNRRSKRKLAKRNEGVNPRTSFLPQESLKLKSIAEVMEMKAANDLNFSLMVYAAAYGIAMQEYAGSIVSAESVELLEICSREIACGHRIAVSTTQ